MYITRHGQDEDNAKGILNGHRDFPLTEVGIKQAHELAEGIKKAGLMFDVVYTSPLLRAKKTAEVVCNTLGLSKPVVLDSLIERDFGTMTGRPIEDIEHLCAPNTMKTETVTYLLSSPGAETFPDLLKRAKRALDQIHAEHSSGSVLLVTHGDFGKMLYASFYNIPWQDALSKFHLGNGELLSLEEGVNPEASHVLVKVEQYNQ